MSEVAVRGRGNELALSDTDGFWNEKQLAALRQIGVEGATNGDLAVFHHVCQRTGLDPFARQIHMVKRDGKWVIQTGIDGFRLVGRRAVDASGEGLSLSPVEWCDSDGTWTDVWLKPGYPSAARVTIYRNGHAFPAIALWSEYVQMTRDRESGQMRVTKMWDTRAAGQLAKCAEALAWRKAFPQDLSGVYTSDELAHVRQESPASRPITADDLTGEVVEGELVPDDVEAQVAGNDPALDARSES